MSKFSNWAEKLFVEMDKEMEKTVETIDYNPKRETVQEIEQKLKNMDKGYEALVKRNGFDSKKHYMYSNIRNNLLKQLTEAKIQAYDNDKTAKNPDYVSYRKELKNEVSKEDQNEIIDNRLDSLLRDKLDIGEETEVKLSKKTEEELKRQAEAAEERSKSFIDRAAALRNMINSYDASKKEKNPEYLSYENQCAENEKISVVDQENYKKHKMQSKEVVEDLDQNFIDGLLEESNPDKTKPLSNQELYAANRKLEQDAASYVRDICKEKDLKKYDSIDYFYNKTSNKVYNIDGFNKTYTIVGNIITSDGKLSLNIIDKIEMEAAEMQPNGHDEKWLKSQRSEENFDQSAEEVLMALGLYKYL